MLTAYLVAGGVAVFAFFLMGKKKKKASMENTAKSANVRDPNRVIAEKRETNVKVENPIPGASRVQRVGLVTTAPMIENNTVGDNRDPLSGTNLRTQEIADGTRIVIPKKDPPPPPDPGLEWEHVQDFEDRAGIHWTEYREIVVEKEIANQISPGTAMVQRYLGGEVDVIVPPGDSAIATRAEYTRAIREVKADG